jgi:hypothetical protein
MSREEQRSGKKGPLYGAAGSRYGSAARATSNITTSSRDQRGLDGQPKLACSLHTYSA